MSRPRGCYRGVFISILLPSQSSLASGCTCIDEMDLANVSRSPAFSSGSFLSRVLGKKFTLLASLPASSILLLTVKIKQDETARSQ